MNAQTPRTPNGISLREVRESDLAVLFEHQRDPVAVALASFKPREKPQFLEHWRKNILANSTVVKRTVLVDAEVAGYIVCFDSDNLRQIGYWIGQSFWGRGVATRALTRFLEEVKERPLSAIVVAHNHPSRRVLEKCGFVLVGKGPTEVEVTYVLED